LNPSTVWWWTTWLGSRKNVLNQAARLIREKDPQDDPHRKHSPEIIQRAIELKKDQPLRSDDAVNQFLQDQFHKKIPKSTLYRYLKTAWATKLKLGITKTKVRCRWTREQTNALWLGDFAGNISASVFVRRTRAS
jgi:hypothetical protein